MEQVAGRMSAGVTMTMEFLVEPQGKSLEDVRMAVRAAVKKAFSGLPEKIVLAFEVRAGWRMADGGWRKEVTAESPPSKPRIALGGLIGFLIRGLIFLPPYINPGLLC